MPSTELKSEPVYVYKIFFGLHGQLSNNVTVNRAVLRGILANGYVDGYTIHEGSGFWEGESEPSDVVIFISDHCIDDELKEVASQYKKQTGQLEVWITRTVESLTIV